LVIISKTLDYVVLVYEINFIHQNLVEIDTSFVEKICMYFSMS